MTKKLNADGTEATSTESKETQEQQSATSVDSTNTSTDATSTDAESTDAKTDNEDDKDLGFPKDTAVVEMSIEEQRNYWKHNSRKHEKAKKEEADAKKSLTDELTKLRSDYDALVANSTTEQTDVAKAISDAKIEAAKEERAKFAPKFLDLEIKAALGDRYDAEKLKTVLAVTNTTAFFSDAGDVDSEAVKNYFELLFPVPPVPESNPKPPRESHGGHKTSKDGLSRGEAGRSLYQQMRGKK